MTIFEHLTVGNVHCIPIVDLLFCYLLLDYPMSGHSKVHSVITIV